MPSAAYKFFRRAILEEKQVTQRLADFADACCHDNHALRPQSAMEALQLAR